MTRQPAAPRLSLATLPTVVFLGLGACAPKIDDTAGRDPGFIEELPAVVAAIAAPHQNLDAVRLRPEDGCYWYQYHGPVETTMLPLRTIEGRPICTRPQGEAGAG